MDYIYLSKVNFVYSTAILYSILMYVYNNSIKNLYLIYAFYKIQSTKNINWSTMISNSIIINNYKETIGRKIGRSNKYDTFFYFFFFFLSFDRKIYFRLVYDEMNHIELGLHTWLKHIFYIHLLCSFYPWNFRLTLWSTFLLHDFYLAGALFHTHACIHCEIKSSLQLYIDQQVESSEVVKKIIRFKHRYDFD